MNTKFIAAVSVAVLPVLALALFNSFTNRCIKGNGNVETRNLQLDDFTKLDVAHETDVFIEYGETQKVEVKASSNLLDNLNVTVSAGKCSITGKRCITGNESVKIYMTLPRLDNLVVSSSGNVKLGAFNNQNDIFYKLSGSGSIYQTASSDVQKADIAVLGSGNIVFDKLVCQSLSTSVSGSGSMKVNGTASDLSAKVSGSGHLDAEALQVESASVRVSGSGSCGLRVSKSLKAEVSGSGSVGYIGDPAVSSNVSGSGSVHKK